jgi:hypothetical protein
METTGEVKMTRKRSDKFKGVTFNKNTNLWFARIAFSGVRYSLGTYKNREDAEETYKNALRLGCVFVKAWCNAPRDCRGKLGEEITGVSKFLKEEERIKLFSAISDGSETEKELLIW